MPAWRTLLLLLSFKAASLFVCTKKRGQQTTGGLAADKPAVDDLSDDDDFKGMKKESTKRASAPVKMRIFIVLSVVSRVGKMTIQSW